MKHHGGSIQLDTSYTDGCRFIVTIQSVEPLQSTQKKDILLVDDEPLICELIEEALEKHSIDKKANAKDAIECFEETRYQLVICDVSLPDF